MVASMQVSGTSGAKGEMAKGGRPSSNPIRKPGIRPLTQSGCDTLGQYCTDLIHSRFRGTNWGLRSSHIMRCEWKKRATGDGASASDVTSLRHALPTHPINALSARVTSLDLQFVAGISLCESHDPSVHVRPGKTPKKPKR